MWEHFGPLDVLLLQCCVSAEVDVIVTRLCNDCAWLYCIDLDVQSQPKGVPLKSGWAAIQMSWLCKWVDWFLPSFLRQLWRVKMQEGSRCGAYRLVYERVARVGAVMSLTGAASAAPMQRHAAREVELTGGFWVFFGDLDAHLSGLARSPLHLL